MHVAELHIFPVKGFAGSAPDHVTVEPWGLLGDRRWMVVDPAGRFLTQRTLPRMACIQAIATASGMTLSHAEYGRIDVPTPLGSRIAVTVWRSTLGAVPADAAVQAWISAALGQDCRLVHMDDPRSRPVNPAYGRAGETVSFADGYPVLLTSLASLADLNARLAHPVPISRFRANIVVTGADPWAEDRWRTIRIGQAVFRVVKPCDRCIVTTIDQATGQRPDRTEPLRTLGKFRHDEHGIMFGQNLIPETIGEIAVGHIIEVLEHGPPNVQPLL